MGEGTRKVGSAVFWSVSAKGGRVLLGLLSSVIVVRGLGEHDYGVLSLLRAVLTFVVIIAGVGLGQSLLKFLPALRVAGDVRGARVLVRRVLFIQGLVWLGLLAASYLSAGYFERLFSIEGVGTVLWIGVGVAIFELFFTKFTHILNAHYDTKLLSVASIASHLVFIASLLILVPRGAGVVGVLIAAAAGQLVACVILAPKIIRLLAGPGGAESPGVRPGRLVRFSLPFALIGVLNVIVWRQSEVLFLAHFRSPEETGVFDLAYRLPQTILEFIPGTVWPIILAGFSEVYEKNREGLRDAIEKYYKMLFLLSTPICFLGVALGGRMIPILFGEAMAPAAVPTQLFFAIFTVSFFGTPLSMSLYAMEKSHVNLVVYVFMAVVNVGLDILLIPRWGIVGAIIPVASVIALSPFVYKRVLDRFVGDVRIPFAFIGRCFLASSPLLAILLFSSWIDGVVELIVVAALAAVVVFFSFKVFKVIGKEEFELLSSIPIPISARLLKFVSS